MKGFLDGSSKNNCESCCGEVLGGVDREHWVMISKVAVPLGVGTAMAAVISVLMEISDLVLHKSLDVQCINQCTGTLLKIQ